MELYINFIIFIDIFWILLKFETCPKFEWNFTNMWAPVTKFQGESNGNHPGAQNYIKNLIFDEKTVLLIRSES